MLFVFYAVIALGGAAIHYRRHKDRERPGWGPDVFFMWWMVVLLGVGGLIGAAFHLFDGPETAEQIGYTRGNGGFQFENAMGDVAIGVAALMCVRFRGWFWLATLVAVSIQFYGDAGGHIYYWLADDNTKPDNVGSPLIIDLVAPTVAWALWWLSWKRGGDARPDSALRDVKSSAA